MRLFDKLFKKHQEELPLKILDFYKMEKWYYRPSYNVAVYNNKKKFKNLVKAYRKKLDKKRGDQELQVGTYKFIFIMGKIERILIMIEDLDELETHRIKIGRYM